MKKYIIILLFVFPLFSCGTKYNYLDTGVSDPHFEGDMYAYLQSNSYNWDSIVKIIDRARLQDVFRHDDITFMGLTNHSIRQWLIQGGKGYEAGYRQVTDIPEAMCRTIVLSLVIDGGMLRDDIERIELNEKGEYIGGGRICRIRYGNYVWLWTKQEPYMGVDGLGPVSLHMTTLEADQKTQVATNMVASGDIQPYNGVVHALEYSYHLDNIGILPYE